MGQLQKQENKLPAIVDFKKSEQTYYGAKINTKKELIPSEIKFIDSINYELIREIDRNKLIDAVFIVVSNNLRAMASRMVAEDQVLLTNDLVEELTNDYSNLTIKEFELIVKNGIRKKYDDDKIQTVGLSIVNFNYWAKKYMQFKFKMNQQIATKLKSDISKLPPATISKESTLDILREDFKSIVNKYYALPDRKKKLVSVDDYWMENGCKVSSGYLAEKLIEFKLITPEQIESKYKTLLRKSKLPVKAKIESERIIICKLALNLRDAKRNK